MSWLLPAAVLGAVGVFALFVAPWVGAGALLVAVLIVVAGLLAGGTAVATGDVEPRSEPPAPRLPGPDEPQGRTD